MIVHYNYAREEVLALLWSIHTRRYSCLLLSKNATLFYHSFLNALVPKKEKKH